MYIKISSRAKTGGKYSAPTILIDLFVIQAISIFLLKWVLLIILTRLYAYKHGVVMAMYVYKNQRSCKNGRKIFRPYNFNRFIRHSDDFNFSVKMGIVNHSHTSLMRTNIGYFGDVRI